MIQDSWTFFCKYALRNPLIVYSTKSSKFWVFVIEKRLNRLYISRTYKSTILQIAGFGPRIVDTTSVSRSC